MSTNLESTSLPPLGPLYGAFFFGIIVCTALYGITCMQTFFYYVHYRNDSTRMKYFVATLWVLNTVHEILSVSGVYLYIMAGLVTPLSIMITNPEVVLQLVVTAAISVASQGFFVYRIYVFNGKSRAVALLWVLLAILQLVSTSIYVIKALFAADAVELSSQFPFTTLASLYLSVAAGVDILIAILMTYLLVRERTDSDFASTARMLQRLVVFSVNTGTWTAVFALSTVALVHAFPSYMIYIAPGISLGPLYCNTVLANLNVRAYIRGGEMTDVVDMDVFRDSGLVPRT